MLVKGGWHLRGLNSFTKHSAAAVSTRVVVSLSLQSPYNMSKTIKVILAIIPILNQCVNLDTFPQVKEQKILIKTYINNCDPSVIIRSVSLKSFQSNNCGLVWTFINLKQWKRRRRWSGKLEGQKLREKRSDTEPVLGEHSFDFVNIPPQVPMAAPTRSYSVVARFKDSWPVSLWSEWLFKDDYLLLINSHWLYFPPPPAAINYTLGGLYIALMIVGCSGNALVLVMYFRCRTLRTPGNILVANLALSDFLMLAKTPIFIFNSFHLGPALGKPGCVIYGFIGGLTGTTSIATLAAIALDRYWAVVRPLEPLRTLTAVRARLFAVGAWLYAALFASVPALDIGYGRYVPEGFLTSCSFDYLTNELPPRYFIFVFFCAAWVAPFCTISFCYLNILRVVVGNRVVTTNQEHRLSTRHVKEQTKRKAEIKLAILVIAVIALFFISWTPYAVVALLGIFGRKDLVTPIASMIPALFCKTAACINPFIYIITHPTFRREFKKMLSRNKSKHMGGTMKTIGYSEAASRGHRLSKDLSDTDVEIIEMKDIPYQTDVSMRREEKLKTLSKRVCDRQDSQTSISIKSIEENVVSPPSWYNKPKFAKKRSFRTSSTRSVLSFKADPNA